MEVVKYKKADIETQFSVEQKLKDIVEQIEQGAKAQQKVICRVRVNGLLLSENDESRFATTNHEDIQEIEVELEKLSSLISNSVKSLIDFANALKDSTVVGAELFREGSSVESNRLFANLVPRVQCMTEALVALKPNIERMQCGGNNFIQNWANSEAHMVKTVTELILAYEKQDFVLVSDVLEYELFNSIENWVTILSELS